MYMYVYVYVLDKTELVQTPENGYYKQIIQSEVIYMYAQVAVHYMYK